MKETGGGFYALPQKLRKKRQFVLYYSHMSKSFSLWWSVVLKTDYTKVTFRAVSQREKTVMLFPTTA